MYICTICNKEFKSLPALHGHQTAHKSIYETCTCSICGKQFSKQSSLLLHKNYCSENKLVETKPSSTYNVDKEVFCRYCNKQCKNENSLKQHEVRCKENPDRKCFSTDGFNSGKITPWNKGVTKETDERMQKNSDSVKKFYETHPGSFTGKQHSDEYKNNMSQLAKNRGLGGFNMRKASVDYNGTSLDSSYELVVAKSLDENNIKWQRCNRFKYTHPDGSEHYYTPDFYLPQYDVYLDPKNDYLIENINPYTGMTDVEKIQRASAQNNIRVIILDKDSLTWDKIKELL